MTGAPSILQTWYNNFMKCTVCGNEMQVKNQDTSDNQKPGSEYKKYNRILYRCENDDVWISVETPVNPPQNLA